MEEEFNQKKYINEFNKANYTQFNVRLLKYEKKELEQLLKAYNINNADFLRKSIKNFKEELKMKKFYVTSGTLHCEKRGEWIYGGEVLKGNDNTKIFDDILDARAFYDSIELKDVIEGNNRYSDYKELYEIDGTINDIDDIDLDNAKYIIDEYTFVDYK